MTPRAHVIVGPTAAGKSSVAHLLAKRMGLPIISADAMAVYAGMDIGTAKASHSERSEVEYLGLDLVPPDQDFSTSDWLAALPTRPLYIVAGGTGLYVKSLLAGIDATTPADDELRAELADAPVRDLQDRLKHVNPAWLERLADPENPRRLIRAIERAVAGEQPPVPRTGPPDLPPVVGLARDPEELRTRIRSRVEAMFDAGLVAEAEALRARYPQWSKTAEQAIGYREALNGDRDELETVVTRTNKLAKRQRTWFRHQLNVNWVEVGGDESIDSLAERVQALWETQGSVPLLGISKTNIDEGSLSGPRSMPEPEPEQLHVVRETPPEPVRECAESSIPIPPERTTPQKRTGDTRSMTVHDVPASMRPRERFERFGREAVSEDVLLALILRTGTTGANVIDLANELLRNFGSLSALAEASEDQLTDFDGIGPVKAQILVAALELAKRLAAEKSPARTFIETPIDVAELLREEARTRPTEVFWLLCLDSRNRLLRPPLVVTTGIADATLVHPREVFKEAIKSSSTSVIVAHNHPSGDPSPSAQDIRITRKLVESGKVLSIALIDHIIVGKETTEDRPWFHSIRESGLVSFS